MVLWPAGTCEYLQVPVGLQVPAISQVPDLQMQVIRGNKPIWIQVSNFILKIPVGQVQVDLQVNSWGALICSYISLWHAMDCNDSCDSISWVHKNSVKKSEDPNSKMHSVAVLPSWAEPDPCSIACCSHTFPPNPTPKPLHPSLRPEPQPLPAQSGSRPPPSWWWEWVRSPPCSLLKTGHLHWLCQQSIETPLWNPLPKQDTTLKRQDALCRTWDTTPKRWDTPHSTQDPPSTFYYHIAM